MKISSKKILTHKQPEDVLRIIRESAYCDSYMVDKDSFSIKYAKRDQRGLRIVTPIKGHIVVGNDGTEVFLQVHAGWGVLFGMAIGVLGFVEMVAMLFLTENEMWLNGLATIAFGALIAVFIGLRELEVLDFLEHKLQQ